MKLWIILAVTLLCTPAMAQPDQVKPDQVKMTPVQKPDQVADDCKAESHCRPLRSLFAACRERRMARLEWRAARLECLGRCR